MEGGGGLGWDGWGLFLSGLDWLHSFSYSSRRELPELKHGSGTIQGGSFWVWSKDGTLLDLMMFWGFLIFLFYISSSARGWKELMARQKINQITS